MKILLTNDDGYSARGLEILKEAMALLDAQYWIVAPQNDRSGVSHAMSIKQPMSVKNYAPNCYALTGTPADCVAFAFSQLFDADNMPDIVVSGVNHGSNISDEIIGSGTVAGARAGGYRGVLSIAISQVFRGKKLSDIDDTPISPQKLAAVIRMFLAKQWSPSIFFNVNLPDFPTTNNPRKFENKALMTRLHERSSFSGKLEERISPRGDAYYWYGIDRITTKDDKEINNPHNLETKILTDVEAIDDGAISISAMPIYPQALIEEENLMLAIDQYNQDK